MLTDSPRKDAFYSIACVMFVRFYFYITTLLITPPTPKPSHINKKTLTPATSIDLSSLLITHTPQ